MLLETITPSNQSLTEIQVIIEISKQSGPIKYEFDKDCGLIRVDRFTQTSISYPCDYGFIPNTLGGDGDPIDVLVINNYPVMPVAIMKCRPIGMLLMEDDGGQDEKILAVPTSKLDNSFDQITSLEDVDLNLKNRIIHFFEHYKDLEPNKWVRIKGWGNLNETQSVIKDSIERIIKHGK